MGAITDYSRLTSKVQLTPLCPLYNSSTGFTGVESLSDLIDGDPPEAMRLEKQDSPSLCGEPGGHQ